MLLPSYTGRFEVGLATFCKRVQPSKNFGNAKYPDGRDALKLEELAFNVFYPADTSGHNGHKKPHKNVDWLQRLVHCKSYSSPLADRRTGPFRVCSMATLDSPVSLILFIYVMILTIL